eukprot:g226.t1
MSRSAAEGKVGTAEGKAGSPRDSRNATDSGSGGGSDSGSDSGSDIDIGTIGDDDTVGAGAGGGGAAPSPGGRLTTKQREALMPAWLRESRTSLDTFRRRLSETRESLDHLGRSLVAFDKIVSKQSEYWRKVEELGRMPTAAEWDAGVGGAGADGGGGDGGSTGIVGPPRALNWLPFEVYSVLMIFMPLPDVLAVASCGDRHMTQCLLDERAWQQRGRQRWKLLPEEIDLAAGWRHACSERYRALAEAIALVRKLHSWSGIDNCRGSWMTEWARTLRHLELLSRCLDDTRTRAELREAGCTRVLAHFVRCESHLLRRLAAEILANLLYRDPGTAKSLLANDGVAPLRACLGSPSASIQPLGSHAAARALNNLFVAHAPVPPPAARFGFSYLGGPSGASSSPTRRDAGGGAGGGAGGAALRSFAGRTFRWRWRWIHQSGSMAHGGEAEVQAHIYDDGRIEGTGSMLEADGAFEIFGTWKQTGEAGGEAHEFMFWKRDLKDGELPQGTRGDRSPQLAHLGHWTRDECGSIIEGGLYGVWEIATTQGQDHVLEGRVALRRGGVFRCWASRD